MEDKKNENSVSDSGAAKASNRKKDALKAVIEIETGDGIKPLSVPKAKELAEKGIKYELISDELEKLRNMAAKKGYSITEFLNELELRDDEERKAELLEKCGGDAELVESIMRLESSGAVSNRYGFAELQRFYPEIKSLEDLPKEVLEAAQQKGSCLLDEYLRYTLKKQRELEEQISRAKAADDASIGSQKEFETAAYDPAKTEFIKALWGR